VPHLIVSRGAQQDLTRLRNFLVNKSPRAANNAWRAIRSRVQTLSSTPELGRPVDDHGVRELVTPFADAGYVAVYRFDPQTDRVTILAIRHQKEAGY